MKIIKVAEASGLEYGFYLWRDSVGSAWQFARIVEEGWLEKFSSDIAGGSEHVVPYGELIGPVPADKLVASLALGGEWNNADEQWINGLDEGDEIEMLVRARVTEEGRFSAPKTTHWRALGTNFFDRE